MDDKIIKKWNIWKNSQLEDEDLISELREIEDQEDQVFDRFYRELEFGTGGLRGIIGVGTNRMNIYTVAKASQGYASYLKKKYEFPSVAIAYDSRIKSEYFSHIAAEVFAANGVKVYIYPELMPTPALSFAVRYLKCSGGVVVTASHNPSKYNGYKVYNSDGCQITTETAKEILHEIESVEVFEGVKRKEFQQGLETGSICYIKNQVFDEYIKAVSRQVFWNTDKIDKNVSIIYTPLNGTGLKCVTTCLKLNGFSNISVVEEQATPDGNFPTCPYPNPEMENALELGLRDAKEFMSDLVIATDPDCDRVGIAVRDNCGSYVLLSGNEVGLLLLDYICKCRKETNSMPANPVMIKTIVTTDLARKIADSYGVTVIDVLTGFKYIGEQIGLLQEKEEVYRYILGFEESYGYLTGSYVRDKDAVNGSLMICEMFAFYKTLGKSLIEVLDELYEKFGYCLNTLHSYEFEGAEGFHRMQNIMKLFRDSIPERIAGYKISAVSDYEKSFTKYISGNTEKINLPKSDVLKVFLENEISIVIRPSGTEPKLKMYLSVSAPDKKSASMIEKELVDSMELFIR